MLRFLAVRIGSVPPTLLLIALGVFLLIHAAPGDPALYLLPDQASDEAVASARARWGLDQPFHVQFTRFVTGLVQGDLGTSFRYQTPVLDMILQRLPATLELALFGMMIAVAAGLAAGIYAGLKANSLRDNVASVLSFIGMSIPGFWLGIMLILVFAGFFRILPSSGRMPLAMDLSQQSGFLLVESLLRLKFDDAWLALRHITLPALTLALPLIAIIMRVTRSSIIGVLSEPYINTARAKGIGENAVIWRHAVKNSLLVVVTVVGLELGALLSGSLIIEIVYSWPGIGSLLIYGIGARDYPLVTGVVLMYTALFLIINVVVDTLYGALDPRIRV